ncbi:MAG: HNH endonuclease [Bdellovibrionales bacterium]
MTKHMQIHEKALEVAGRFRKSESDLIDILQQVDEHRVYLHLRCKRNFRFSEVVSLKLKRAQELESQRQQKNVNFEETFEALLDVYLEKKDPVQKAVKLMHRAHQPVLRQVQRRDQGQCTYKNPQGVRCTERKWLHTHHVIPKSKGGQDTFENLATLCAGHHRLTHSH